MRIAFALALLLPLSACGAVSTVNEPVCSLLLEIQPPEARISENEERIGSARALAGSPLRMACGTHRITITADGFFPHDQEIELVPGTTRAAISLRAIPR